MGVCFHKNEQRLDTNKISQFAESSNTRGAKTTSEGSSSLVDLCNRAIVCLLSVYVAKCKGFILLKRNGIVYNDIMADRRLFSIPLVDS